MNNWEKHRERVSKSIKKAKAIAIKNGAYRSDLIIIAHPCKKKSTFASKSKNSGLRIYYDEACDKQVFYVLDLGKAIVHEGMVETNGISHLC